MSENHTKDYRLVPIALATWLIAGLSVCLPKLPGALVLVGVAIVCAGLVLLKVHSLRPALALLVSVVGLLIVVFLSHPQRADRSHLLDAAGQGFVVSVQGKVVTEPRQLNSSFGTATYSFALDPTTLLLRGNNLDNPSRLQVIVSPNELGTGTQSIPYGAQVSFSGRLSIKTPSARDGISIQPTTEVVLETPPAFLDRATNQIRADLTSLTEPMSEQARALVPGAAIGDTSAMSQELKDAMKVAGLTHITAVSGSHFAVLFVAIGALAGRLPRLPRAVVMAAVSAGFVLLVHPSGPVLRASLMAAITLIALLSRRPSQAVAALSCTVITLLIFDPFNATDIGFALSVAATGAIIEYAKPLARWLNQPSLVHNFVPEKAALFIAVPLVAQLAVLPLLALLQPFIGTYALVANLLAAPVVAPTAILSLLAALCAGWWHHAAALLATLASGGTWWIAYVARTISSLPGAKIPWPQGLFGAALAVMSVIGLVVCARLVVAIALVVRARHTQRILAGESGKTWPKPLLAHRTHDARARAIWATRYPRKLATIAAVVLVVCALCFTLSPPWLTRIIARTSDAEPWSVLACDVGQGDAFLVKSNSTKVYMVDAGPPDAGIASCLNAHGISSVSVLFLSHYHNDHVGGLEELLNHVEIEKIIAGPPIGDQATIAAVAEVAAHHQVPLSQVPADSSKSDGGTAIHTSAVLSTQDWEILWPTNTETKHLEAASSYGETVTNDASLVVHFPQLQGGISALFLGDLEQDGQDRLARSLTSGKGLQSVDVVKMAHHGSKSQSERLAQVLNPSVTLVGVGSDNTYGHPSARAVGIFARQGSAVLRTDQCGTFKLSHESDRWFVVGHCP